MNAFSSRPWSSSCFLVVIAASVGVALASTYSKPEFGFVAAISDDWRIHAERKEEKKFIVSFGLPAVWSDLEKQNIENAVSVTVYRDSEIDSLTEVVELEAKRVADILVSRQEVPSNLGKRFVEVTRIRGLEYKSLTTCHFANGLGYVIAFTATRGTYDTNIGKFLSFLAALSFVPLDDKSQAVSLASDDGSSFHAQAKVLYKQGPSKAEEIIELLRKELQVRPGNADAMYLLGLTYYGTGRLDQALKEFDGALALTERDGSINAELRFCRARTLFYLGQCSEAKHILDVFWALWQDGEALQQKYEELYPDVLSKCGGQANPALQPSGTEAPAAERDR